MYTQMKFPLGKEKGNNGTKCILLYLITKRLIMLLTAKNKHENMSVSYLLKCFHLPNVAEGVIKIATDKIRSTAQWYVAKIF